MENLKLIDDSQNQTIMKLQIAIIKKIMRLENPILFSGKNN